MDLQRRRGGSPLYSVKRRNAIAASAAARRASSSGESVGTCATTLNVTDDVLFAGLGSELALLTVAVFVDGPIAAV